MRLLDLYQMPNTIFTVNGVPVFREGKAREIEICTYRKGVVVILDSEQEVKLKPDGTFTVVGGDFGIDRFTLRLMRIIPFTEEHTLMLSLGIKEEDLCEP